MDGKEWYTLEKAEVVKRLNSREQGLSREEGARRLAEFGPNELKEKEKESPVVMLLAQFTNFLVLILIAAAIISGVIGEFVEAIAIIAIVILAGLLGFLQKYRAEKALEALKRMAALTASVIRDGEEYEIPARELVPGDVILLRAGDKIPADARALEVMNLKVNESPLTGESMPIEKSIEPIKEEVPVGDRKNMVFMGTAVTYGRGKAMVVATGMATEFGRIAGMLGEIEEKRTPLQVSLDKTGKLIGIFALAISGAIAALGIFKGYGILEMFVWGVALAIAVIPEALPAVVTISLALGARRMVKRNVLIRSLQAVETLGSTSVICSDKTGTLTRDEMTVRKIWVNGKEIDVTGAGYEPDGGFYVGGEIFNPEEDVHIQTLMRISALCNDARLVHASSSWDIKGDPTEGALIVAAAKARVWQEKLNSEYPRIKEVPFSSERKRMTTIHSAKATPPLYPFQQPTDRVSLSKGAPEVILDSCTHIYLDGREKELSKEYKGHILEIASQMATDALRVLGMAYKRLPDAYSSEEAESGMVFVGLMGMIDPPREEVKEAIKVCEGAGIKPIMITGDHKLTAVAIAKELDLLRDGIAISGDELEALSKEELEKEVEKIEVYARVSPAHKMLVVDAFAKKGHVVAMTGDGVNDAPALKKADIGIAMGITGTDVSRETSDMVLIDDNFASIVSAVEEGRSIFINIRKYTVYLLSGNMGAVVAMVAALLMNLPLPLTAVQILFINLLMDGAPAVALGVEPPEKGVMKRPPRNPKKGIFNLYASLYIPCVGAWIGAGALGVFSWMLSTTGELQKAMTMFFATLIMLRLANAFNCRSAGTSLFKIGMFTNTWLIYASMSSFLLMLAAIYMPFLQIAFETVPLNSTDWVVILAVSFSVFLAVEMAKLIAPLREKLERQVL